MTSTAAPSLAGLCLGGISELAAAVQGTWQTAAAAGHRAQQQQRKLRRAGPGYGEQKQKAPAAEAAAAGRTVTTEDVGRCGGAMSHTTLNLLLDRFTPSY